MIHTIYFSFTDPKRLAYIINDVVDRYFIYDINLDINTLTVFIDSCLYPLFENIRHHINRNIITISPSNVLDNNIIYICSNLVNSYKITCQRDYDSYDLKEGF